VQFVEVYDKLAEDVNLPEDTSARVRETLKLAFSNFREAQKVHFS